MTHPSSRPISVFVAAGPDLLAPLIRRISDSRTLQMKDFAENGENALALLEGESCDVVLIDFALPGLSGVKLAEFLTIERPEIISVLISVQDSSEHWRKAVLAGARELIAWPIAGPDLDFTLERVVQITRARTRRHKSGAKDAIDKKDRDSRSIVLGSRKGGVGVSFLAANFAGVIAEHPLGLRMALVDFNLTSADLATILNVKPIRTLAHLALAAEMDQGLLASIACPVADGFDLYPGPPETDVTPVFTADFTTAFIECCRAGYDLVLIDLGTYLNEAVAPVLRTADMIIPVTAPDVLSIRATAKFIRLLERLGVGKDVIKPVVNEWNAGDLALDRISDHIGAPVAAGLLRSREVRQLLDEGRLLTSDDDSALKTSIDSLVKDLMSALGLLDGLRV